MRYIKLLGTGLFFALLTQAQAQVPPAEQLLPEDTVAVASIPDYQKIATFYDQSPFGRLWADPSMKPFREKFMTQLNKEMIDPLEKELGIDLAQYKELLQGQVTLAIAPTPEGSEEPLSILLLIDTRDKAEALTTRLAELRKKWTDSGKELRTERVRDVELTRISFSQTEVQGLLKNAFPSNEEEEEDADESDSNEQNELYVGQVKSLFIAGEDLKTIEKVLARVGGGELRPLAEQPAFQASHNQLFRNSLGFAWLNFKPVYEQLLKSDENEPQEEPTPGMPQFEAAKILPALGLAGLNSFAASLMGGPEGTTLEAFISVPEAQREGIFRILTLESKPSSPPLFVPADVVKFHRIRIDAQKAWSAAEAMLGKIEGMAGMMQMMLGVVEQVAQQQDPNFTFKKNFIGNLGDDFVSYEKLPRGTDLEALAAPPSLMLIGSPRPAQLADAMRFVSMLANAAGPPEEREFLGKKIYSIKTAVPQPATGEEDEDAEPVVKEQTLNFAASGDYVAFSADAAMLEEYLRSSGTPIKPLRELSGLTEAAQQAGGMSTGYFSYENQKESYRLLWEAVKKNPDLLSQGMLQFNIQSEGEDSGLTEWMDFSTLPEFDQVSKYFGIAVMTIGTTPEGFRLRAYGPTPPGAR